MLHISQPISANYFTVSTLIGNDQQVDTFAFPLLFLDNFEQQIKSLTWENSKTLMNVLLVLSSLLKTHKKASCLLIATFHTLQHECNYNDVDPLEFQRFVILQHHHLQIPMSHIFISKRCPRPPYQTLLLV